MEQEVNKLVMENLNKCLQFLSHVKLYKLNKAFWGKQLVSVPLWVFPINIQLNKTLILFNMSYSLTSYRVYNTKQN